MVLEFVVYHRKFGRCATCDPRFDWFGRSSSEAEKKKKKSRTENPDRGDLCCLCPPLAEDARVIHGRGALRVYRNQARSGLASTRPTGSLGGSWPRRRAGVHATRADDDRAGLAPDDPPNDAEHARSLCRLCPPQAPFGSSNFRRTSRL